MSFFESNLPPVHTRAPLTLVPQCGSCGLLKQCISPKMPIWGKGERGVLVIGESPGAQEDRQGVPFYHKAKSGSRLHKTLKGIGVSLERDCWTMNSLICRPPHNATPTPAQIGYCRPNIINAIRDLKPKVIILLGNAPLNSLIPYTWGVTEKHAISKWAGLVIPDQKTNAWICPTWHPSYLERMVDAKGIMREPVYELYFKKHLKAAFSKKEEPYKEIPNYKKQVQIIFKPKLAAKLIQKFIDAKNPVAIDYETNCKKPDNSDSEIISCAISDGQSTISYPWMGEAITRTGELLNNKNVPKIGSNIKYEQRWTKAKLGFEGVGWLSDTMLMAHHLDNRLGITSIKFQAYAMLGEPIWNKSVEPYLETKGGGYTLNRVKEVDLQQLLLYGGLDALLEIKVYQAQVEKLKRRMKIDT